MKILQSQRKHCFLLLFWNHIPKCYYFFGVDSENAMFFPTFMQYETSKQKAQHTTICAELLLTIRHTAPLQYDASPYSYHIAVVYLLRTI